MLLVGVTYFTIRPRFGNNRIYDCAGNISVLNIFSLLLYILTLDLKMQ
jgi:hypothetical protein